MYRQVVALGSDATWHASAEAHRRPAPPGQADAIGSGGGSAAHRQLRSGSATSKRDGTRRAAPTDREPAGAACAMNAQAMRARAFLLIAHSNGWRRP
jgi:hypothetical protein